MRTIITWTGCFMIGVASGIWFPIIELSPIRFHVLNIFTLSGMVYVWLCIIAIFSPIEEVED